MRRSNSILSALACLMAAVGCNISKLVDAPPSGDLRVTPASVVVTAAAGSSAGVGVPLAIVGVHGGAVHWTVRRSSGAEWLTFVPGTGTTPGTLQLTLLPTGRAAGTYRDTLLFTSDGADAVPTRVPVTLNLQGCGAGTLTLGSLLADSLRATDCESLHHQGRPARRYHFSGSAGDSVSFRLTTTAFPAILTIDTADVANAPSLATTGSCFGLAGACIRYLVLPRSGSYTVEVTSSGSGPGTGSFTLFARHPGPPSPPDQLRQTKGDLVSVISIGGATPDPEVVVVGLLNDPDVSDTLRLEVELLPVGSSFTGVVTATSAATVSGGTASAHVTGLLDGTGYHWRSRVVDQTGRATDWASFGGNAESSPDLRVSFAAARIRFLQQPTTSAAGVAIVPAVKAAAVDLDGNVVSSFDGIITVALATGPAGAILSGDGTATAVNGVATFPGLSLDKAGSGYTLLASSPGMIDATSLQFTVTAGGAGHLAFTQQPTGSTPNAPITPAVVVTVTDANGNIVTSFNGSMTIALGHDASPQGNAHLTGTLTVASAAGVARFADLRIDRLGAGYTLIASVAGVGAVTSAAFDVTPLAGSPTEQIFTSQPTAAAAGAVIVPVIAVTIRDGLGMPVTDFTGPVTLTLSGGTAGAVLLGTLTEVPSSGVAQFADIAVDRAGTGYRLRATTATLPDVLSDPFDITAPPPTTGTITVTTTTTGSNLDPDGYTAVVAGVSHAITVNGTSTFTNVPPGTQSVALNGVASNCTVSGTDPRNATVTAGLTTTVAFTITCAVIPPTTGTITVTTTTTGSNLDPDGYTAVVAGVSHAITVNGTTTFTSVPVGTQSVALNGVAANCTVSGTDPRNATVTAGLTTTVAFAIACAVIPPTTGTITVTTTTTGSDLDPDGYTAVVAGVSHAITVNGTTTFTSVPVGTQSVALNGVAANCTVSGADPRNATVTAGLTTTVAFTIACAVIPPPTGDLIVTSTTAGADMDPDGYTVTVAGGGTRSLADSASTTFTALPIGATQVSLTGVAANCAVAGVNPRSVTVTSGTAVTTTFAVSCVHLSPPPPPMPAPRSTVP